jgi:hypothetical protein
VTTVMPFESAVRAIIEGRTFGFCKGGEQPSPAEPTDASHASFRTEQNPEGPGAFVTHVPEGFFIAGDANLSAVVGISFADLVQTLRG